MNASSQDLSARLDEMIESPESEHPSDIFRDVDDDFWLWLHTDGRVGRSAVQAMLPGLPTEEEQRRWTGKTGRDTQVEGFEIYKTMRSLHEKGLS